MQISRKVAELLVEYGKGQSPINSMVLEFSSNS